MNVASLTVESLAAPPFLCLNCDAPISKPILFCSDLCKDEAKFVRYFRACLRDGRYDQTDVQEALRIRLAHILGGGYAERARRLSQTVREAVISRDGGRCRKCGNPGNQIDHIRGGSGDPGNLQLLCVQCHNEKTVNAFKFVSADSHPEEWAKRELLLARVHLPKAARLCDSSRWDGLWRVLMKARKDASKSA